MNVSIESIKELLACLNWEVIPEKYFLEIYDNNSLNFIGNIKPESETYTMESVVKFILIRGRIEGRESEEKRMITHMEDFVRTIKRSPSI